MGTLGDITRIEQNITNGKLKTVKALHIAAFGDEGRHRLVRKDLRRFTGFHLDKNSDEYVQKVSVIKQNLSTSELIGVSQILNLDYEGDVDEVANRLCSFLNDLKVTDEDENEDDESDEEEDDEGDEDEDEDEDNIPLARLKHLKNSKSTKAESFALTFRDVEESIRKFNGKDDYPITKWISDFEEMADITGWNNLQKLLFAKKSLTGLAKLFVQSEKGIKSWEVLRDRLLSEFEIKVSSAQIHKLLMTRRKAFSETVQEYALIMREIGSRASLEAEVVIQYIIDGIPDDTSNKIILYGARSFAEFKGKIKLYEEIKSKKTMKMEKQQGQDRNDKRGFVNEKKGHYSNNGTKVNCFNCGSAGHKSKECPDKSKGTKCFKCNNFGHLSRQCSRKEMSSQGSSLSSNVTIIDVLPKNTVTVKCEQVNIAALFDTGSDISVFREDVYHRYFGSKELSKELITVRGLGTSKVQTLGSLWLNVEINGDNFGLTFHVIPVETSSFQAILGNDLLLQAEVHIGENGIIITKRRDDNFLMNISVDKESSTEEFSLTHIVNKDHRETVSELIKNYKPEKVINTNIQMKIILKSEEPIYQRPRRLSVVEKVEVDKQISQWLEDGIIRESCSDYASPIVLVKKKDGSTRICCDYRKINKEIVKDRFPLPLIEDVMDQLENAKIFTTIDLKNGFFHVDALSRYPQVFSIVEEDGIKQRMKAAQEKDEAIVAIKKILQLEEEYEGYLLKHDLLYKYHNGKELIVVPKGMQNEIIKKVHDEGHFAIKKTKEVIKNEYFIPKLEEKISSVISNCVPCILGNRKEGKKEGFFHPIPKQDGPLHTYHADHLGPIPSTNKNYQYILAIIDDFTKFTWLYPTKSTTAHETVNCLIKQAKNFGNPGRIITDKGTAFTGREFKEYCTDEGISHVNITTGVARGNGQIERIHRIVIPVLTKLSIEDPTKWYRFLDRVQRALNATFQRSINTTPFEVLTGVKMRRKEDVMITNLIEEETRNQFCNSREELRKQCKEQLVKVQEENRKRYNLRRKKPITYRIGDLVAIKRTQFGGGLKVSRKFLGPYEVVKVKDNDRYDVVKAGNYEGPIRTSTCSEYMKPWLRQTDESESDS